MEDCTRCSELRLRYKILGPHEFRKAQRVIRANLDDSTIADTTRHHGSTDSFDSLSLNGPWPDYIEHHFECNGCGQRFRLAVETYHGTGGTWEPLDHGDERGLKERA